MPLAAPASSAEVTVQDRAILVDGRPFVVRGAAGTTQLAELKGLGANTVRTYGGNADRLVAEAERLGLKVILGFRSEEHTSELQSLMRISYAVFCLKKKKHQSTPHEYEQHINVAVFSH